MFTWINKKIINGYHSIVSYFKKIELEKINNKERDNLSILWRNDFDIVLAAVKNQCCEYKDVPIKWRTNKNIMIAFLNRDPFNLKLFRELQDDEETVCLLLLKEPSIFEHASLRLQSKASVARIVAAKEPLTLRYASESLKNNKVFMLEMTLKYGMWGFTHASKKLKNDWEFLLRVLMQPSRPHETLLYKIPWKFLMNEDFILAAALVNDEPYRWIRGLWIHRANEITPGLSDKLKKTYTAANSKRINGIDCCLYTALIKLATEKEKELENRGIYIPAKIYITGAIYGLLSTSTNGNEAKISQPLPHIPLEIAAKISEFSPIYSRKLRAISSVNRTAKAMAEEALLKARSMGSFNFSI